MRIFVSLLYFALIHSFDLLGQSCNCSGMVNWNTEAEIELLDNPNGAGIGTYSNDFKNENFLIFDFLDSDEEYFKVSIQYAIDGEPKVGWIKKTEYLGTFASNYSDGTVLNFYSKPNTYSEVKSSIDKWHSNFYTITDCNDAWVKVSVTLEETEHSGWIERKWQCTNPYTTCN